MAVVASMVYGTTSMACYCLSCCKLLRMSGSFILLVELSALFDIQDQICRSVMVKYSAHCKRMLYMRHIMSAILCQPCT